MSFDPMQLVGAEAFNTFVAYSCRWCVLGMSGRPSALREGGER
jgi:hypothetical protein